MFCNVFGAFCIILVCLVPGRNMPKSCSFGLCKNTTANSSSRFFKFPSSDRDAERRSLWAVRCARKTVDGRNWEPKPNVVHVYVCSDHFVSGAVYLSVSEDGDQIRRY